MSVCSYVSVYGYVHMSAGVHGDKGCLGGDGGRVGCESFVIDGN